MKLSFFCLLREAFPKGDLRFSTMGGELYDTNNKMIGYVPHMEIFVLVAEYEYFDIAKEALEKHGINHESQGGVEALYAMPKNLKSNKN